MLSHSKDVLVRMLPQILQYRIPLYLPAERIVFDASELIINIKHTQDLSYFELKNLDKRYTPLQIDVENLKNPKIELK